MSGPPPPLIQSTKINLAPLPPQPYSNSASKAKSVNKVAPYLTLSVEKNQSVVSLNKSNSKRRLAVFGNNMISPSNNQQQLPNADLNFSPPP